MDEFLSKFGLDKHHKMERFGLSFFVIFVALLGVSVGAYSKYSKNHKQQLSSQAIYTQRFSTSLSQVEGEVVNIYRNKDYTKSFVLLKFSDMTSLPVNAENYQIFLTSESGVMNINPKATIYMFGSTGYMGLYFVENRGFPKDIYDIVIRNNKKLADSEVSDDTVYETYDGDNSFAEFDQLRVYANLGAKDAIVVDFLDEKDVSVSEIYEATVTGPEEREIRDKLGQDLADMQSALVKLDEYESRLTDLGIQVPDRPLSMRNDEIVTGPYDLVKDNATHFELSSQKEVKTEDSDFTTSESTSVANQILNTPTTEASNSESDTELDVNAMAEESTEVANEIITNTESVSEEVVSEEITTEEITTEEITTEAVTEESTETVQKEIATTEAVSNDKEDEASHTLRLKTDYVLPGGYEFNWQDGSLKTGYIDAIAGDWTYAQLFTYRSNEQSTSDYNVSTTVDSWYRLDGTSFSTVDESVLPEDDAIKQAIQDYNGAISSYLSAKTCYQITDLKSLLTLEVQIKSTDTNFSVYNKEDVITVY